MIDTDGYIKVWYVPCYANAAAAAGDDDDDDNDDDGAALLPPNPSPALRTNAPRPHHGPAWLLRAASGRQRPDEDVVSAAVCS